MLTCRLVLNLRRVPRDSDQRVSRSIGVGQQQSVVPQMQFAARPFLGNIGAPLREDGDSLGDETEGDASEELELISVEQRSGKMGLVEIRQNLT